MCFKQTLIRFNWNHIHRIHLKVLEFFLSLCTDWLFHKIDEFGECRENENKKQTKLRKCVRRRRKKTKHSWQTTNKQYFFPNARRKSHIHVQEWLIAIKVQRRWYENRIFMPCAHISYSTYIRWTDEKSQRIVSALYTQNCRYVSFIQHSAELQKWLSFTRNHNAIDLISLTDSNSIVFIIVTLGACTLLATFRWGALTMQPKKQKQKQFKRRKR